jgi:hypothetical protein
VDVAESVLLGGGEFDEPGGAGGDEGRIGGIEAEKVMVVVHHEEDVLFVKRVLTIAGGGVEHDDRAERGLLVVFVLVRRRRWRRGVGRLGRLVLFDAPKGGARSASPLLRGEGACEREVWEGFAVVGGAGSVTGCADWEWSGGVGRCGRKGVRG